MFEDLFVPFRSITLSSVISNYDCKESKFVVLYFIYMFERRLSGRRQYLIDITMCKQYIFIQLCLE